MIEIRPFKGVLYNQKKIPLKNVIAPPYDVISHQQQDRFYRLHSKNIIRLILGKTYPRDNNAHNRYKRASALYRKWLEEKVLIVDDAPSIYVLRVDFKENGKRKTRTGFIALASLKGKGRLIPHERTFAGPKKDRLELLAACRANFSQIFTLYSDPQQFVTGLFKPYINKKPVLKVRYMDEEHSLWKIADTRTIDKLINSMRNRNIFIADGHHRYAVAQAYSREMITRYGYSAFPGSHFTMLYFTNMDEQGLSILPTHRLIREGLINKEGFEKLGNYFRIISYPYRDSASFKTAECRVNKILEKNRLSFALLTKGERDIKVFVLRKQSFMKHFVKGQFSPAKKNLSTIIVDEGVLKSVLKIKNFEENISYTRDIEEAKRRVERGDISHAFLLAPVTLNELKSIAGRGEKMPHKSTYFYPKLVSGLIIYDHLVRS